MTQDQTQTEVVIREGEALAIYSDRLLPYIGGKAKIKRVSHVEPDPGHLRGGNWCVDLTQVGGDWHFVDDQAQPFMTRGHALAFEREWLKQHVLKLGGQNERDPSRETA